MAYFPEGRFFMTCLNGAVLVMVFRICDYWAYNQEYLILKGKTGLFKPVWEQDRFPRWAGGGEGKKAWFWGGVFRDPGF